jgi:hypothetical protein
VAAGSQDQVVNPVRLPRTCHVRINVQHSRKGHRRICGQLGGTDRRCALHPQSRTRLLAQSRTKYEVPTSVNRYLTLDWNLVWYRRAKFGSSAYTSLAWIFDWTPAWDSEWPTRSPNTDRIMPTVDLMTLLSPAASLSMVCDHFARNHFVHMTEFEISKSESNH